MFLLSSNQTITNVALQYGYSSSSSYSKAFKKHHGASPADFIKARIDKPPADDSPKLETKENYE